MERIGGLNEDQVRFLDYLKSIQNFYETYNIKYSIDEDSLKSLLEIYFEICEDNLIKKRQKNYLIHQIFRLFVLVRYRTSIMLAKASEETNVDILGWEIILIHKEKRMVSSFFKRHQKIFRELNGLRIDDDIKQSLKLRQKISASKVFSVKDKDDLLQVLDELINMIIREDDIEVILHSKMTFDNFKEIITLSKSNPDNYDKVKEWIMLNKDNIGEDTFSKVFEFFSDEEKIIN